MGWNDKTIMTNENIQKSQKKEPRKNPIFHGFLKKLVHKWNQNVTKELTTNFPPLYKYAQMERKDCCLILVIFHLLICNKGKHTWFKQGSISRLFTNERWDRSFGNLNINHLNRSYQWTVSYVLIYWVPKGMTNL